MKRRQILAAGWAALLAFMPMGRAGLKQPETRSIVRPCTYAGYFDRGTFVTAGLPPALLVMGTRISDYYGLRLHPILNVWMLHEGIDIASPEGTPFFAPFDGVVEVATFMGEFGNYIRIRHSRDYETAYAHASRFADGIRPGARVKRGEAIGYVGTTGLASGNHLHFELLSHGKHVKPACACDCDLRAPVSITRLTERRQL